MRGPTCTREVVPGTNEFARLVGGLLFGTFNALQWSGGSGRKVRVRSFGTDCFRRAIWVGSFWSGAFGRKLWPGSFWPWVLGRELWAGSFGSGALGREFWAGGFGRGVLGWPQVCLHPPWVPHRGSISTLSLTVAGCQKNPARVGPARPVNEHRVERGGHGCKRNHRCSFGSGAFGRELWVGSFGPGALGRDLWVGSFGPGALGRGIWVGRFFLRGPGFFSPTVVVVVPAVVVVVLESRIQEKCKLLLLSLLSVSCRFSVNG